VRYVRRTTLFVKKSTLIVGKCLELRRTLRIRVISCRRRTFNVSFCVSFSEAICGVERPSAPSGECKKKIALVCSCARASDSMFYPLTMCALQIVFMIMIMLLLVRNCRRRKLKTTSSSSSFVIPTAG